jgi:hypothetical protein
VAPLKIPLQVTCPNCQMGNLPGSPYCSRCGASLNDIAPAAAPTGKLTLVDAEDPLKKYLNEGQDPALVRLTYDKAAGVITTGETLQYIATAHRNGLAHSPDCVAVTTKRLMLFRKKMLGKLELDDCYWRDVRNATMRDGKTGVQLTLDAIQGWQLTVEALPKAQAWRIYELAIEFSERLRDTLKIPAPQPAAQGAALKPVEQITPQMPAQELTAVNPFREAAVPVPAPAPMVLASSQAFQPERDAQGLQVVRPTQQPTPESVLQNLLQQASSMDAGAPTRPMSLSAAAFQAPAVAEPQPVTFRDTDTDLQLRPTPPLTTLEQIAVFSGPLSFQQPTRVSTPLNTVPESTPEPAQAEAEASSAAPTPVYHPVAPDPYAQIPGRTSGPLNNSFSQFGDDGKYGALDLSFELPPRWDQPLMLPDELVDSPRTGPMPQDALPMPEVALPVPGSSVASGPLMDALPSDDDESGTLSTQLLNVDLYMDMDRNTQINLAQYGLPERSNGRANRTQPVMPEIKPTKKQPPTRTASRTDDPLAKMTQLKMMLDAGLITSEDYEQKKAEILSRL